MTNLLNSLHPYWPAISLALWWIFSSAIQTMPKPVPMGSIYYLWLYNLLQFIGANHKLLTKGKL